MRAHAAYRAQAALHQSRLISNQGDTLGLLLTNQAGPAGFLLPGCTGCTGCTASHPG